jgi:anti-sigma factor RsiW
MGAYCCEGVKMAPTATCPSLEELAAFLDGRLTGEERAGVVEHLADCESCYTVFAEAAHFQQNSAPAAEGVIPFPFAGKKSDLTRRRPPLRWLPLAAAVLLAVGGAFVYRYLTAMPKMEVA